VSGLMMLGVGAGSTLAEGKKRLILRSGDQSLTSWETWHDGLRDDLLLVWVVAFLEGVICCLTDAFYLIEI
jgi:hypothetical protein